MSRNAYIVKRIVSAEHSSFNLSYHNELVSILEESTDFLDTLNFYGSGIFEISDKEFKKVKENLEEVIDGLEKRKTCQPESKEKAEDYKKILAEMKREIKKEGHISYEIF